MKFREYGEVLPRTVTGDSPQELDANIEAFGSKYDIIDLQYAAVARDDGRVEYSALALYKPKKEND